MHYVLQWNDPSTIYHVGVSVTLHWFILTRSILAPLSPTVFRKSLSLKSQLILFHFFLLEIMILLLWASAHAQKFFFCSIVSSLAAFWRVFFRFLGPTSFYLLEHERTERTRNLRGWKKSEADAYMMRLLLWPNGVSRRILPIQATPTSWQFARVPEKRSAPTSCRAELPAAGLAWASLASFSSKDRVPA